MFFYCLPKCGDSYVGPLTRARVAPPALSVPGGNFESMTLALAEQRELSRHCLAAPASGCQSL